MNYSGVIYQFEDKPASPDPILVRAFDVPPTIPVRVRPSETIVSFKKKLNYSFRAMVGGGMLGLMVLLSPLIVTEAQFRLNPPQPQPEIAFEEIEIVEDTVDTPTFTKLINDKYIQKLAPVNTDFALVIPKIGVNSAIFSNINPADKKEYTAALKQGAAHAEGTALPDQEGSKYIFAHSTDYAWNITQFNAIFYLLKDLETGDQIHIVYNGTLYPYKVTDKKVVDAGDTYYMKGNPNDNHLILQTCYPPGTTWKRLLVFAEPMDSLVGSDLGVSYSLDKSETN